jgi:protein SCO1/2
VLLLLLYQSFPLAAVGHAQQNPGFKSGVFDPPRVAPDFELQGSNGSAVSARRYRGKVVALVFGFTYCQRVCPVTLANLAQVSRKLGAAASDLQVVFVTVDPERDSPERLREYLGIFNPAFVGATGMRGQLEAVRRAYGITVRRESPEDGTPGYQVHHSSSVYLIDREGKLRLLVPFGKPVDAIVHDVKLLLKSEGPG